MEHSWTFVLVPGAGGAGSFWKRLGDELTRRGHQTVAIDLPGPDPEAGLPEYVDLVVEAADGRDVVLVAQSLGGFTAAWAATSTPVAALVLLNGMVPLPRETPGEWWDAVGWSEARRDNDIREGRDPKAEIDLETYFLNDVPAGALDPDEPHRDEAEIVFTTPWAPAAWPDVPTTVLAARHDRFFPFDLQQRVARERLGLEVVPVPGGHLAAISHPVEVADAVIAASRADALWRR